MAALIYGLVSFQGRADYSMKKQAIYRHFLAAHSPETKWDQSINPRSPDLLFEVVANLGINPSWNVLDIGCGHGNNVGELAQRFSCRVQGLEPVESIHEICASSASEGHVSDPEVFVQGDIESIPFDAAIFDLIWCRDMLVHVAWLEQGLKECYRVLKPGGFMVIQTTFATESMEPREQSRLCESLGLVPANLSQHNIEEAFLAAGFEVTSAQWLGSELAEFYEERDGLHLRDLMRIARINRKIPDFGEELDTSYLNLNVSLGLYTWGVYQLLGKLGIMVYVLRKAE